MEDYEKISVRMAADKWFWWKEWVSPALLAIVAGTVIALLISPAFFGWGWWL